MISKPSLGTLLSFNGGYVDTAGFLALQGLFTAHVTGNFVTFGAAIANGTSGAYAKLLALPVFCVVVVSTRLVSHRLIDRGWPVLTILLTAQTVLLFAGGTLAILLGPFANADTGPALLTGMTLVTAMAVQNAAHRAHLAEVPPSTLMTGTTTQIMIDVADLACGKTDASVVRPRLVRLASSVATFAVGCGLAALLYAALGCWCFAIPPLVMLVGLVMNEPIPARVRAS
ncbi:YoaK family protein [Lichenihabitans sp. Uapishka_5]|uniref:YoaK family protein n=1 Tax=Lichenihabitans sp. Uapishka_5 TaxID=3037302 RepID=UPI0029E7D1BA|nr:YoaK family protein [Lichenihabitans sp. Uapishka_5]MDX7951823.1 YoaK family protein [Lichenihabitans sp. Uapishka_5]